MIEEHEDERMIREEMARAASLELQISQFREMFDQMRKLGYLPNIHAAKRALQLQHRTHQQDIFRAFGYLCYIMADEGYEVDGRNEASKAVAQDIVETFGCALKGLPRI